VVCSGGGEFDEVEIVVTVEQLRTLGGKFHHPVRAAARAEQHCTAVVDPEQAFGDQVRHLTPPR
jgi:hypothetical protein